MSATFDVKLEGGDDLIEKLRRMDLNVKKEVRAATVAGAEIIQDAANGLAPGPHIKTRVVSATEKAVTVDIGPDKEHWYYRFVETGATAHEIRGKKGKRLRFEGSDGLVITPQVSHPGMGASPFLRPAHDGNHDTSRDAIGAKLRSTVEAGGS